MPCFSKKKKDFGGRAGDGTYRIPEMDLHADVIKMWGKPFGDGGPRDAARLVHRVVVNNNGMANVGEHREATEFHKLLREKTLDIATLFGPEEAKRAARILDQVHNDRGSDENPDKAIYTGAVLNALGLDNNPTARVFKLFHQRFVLSAYTALLSGPLQDIRTNDDRSAKGWLITVDGGHGSASGEIKVVHSRREGMVDCGGSFFRWEMAMVFDSTMSTLLRTGLKVTELEMGTGPELTEGRQQELSATFGDGKLVLVDVDVDPDGFVVVPDAEVAQPIADRAPAAPAAPPGPAGPAEDDLAGTTATKADSIESRMSGDGWGFGESLNNEVSSPEFSRASSMRLGKQRSNVVYPGFKNLQFGAVTEV